MQAIVHEYESNARRLQAQRNKLNNKVRLLKEELQQLHEQASYVGEVVKLMDKKKALVKVCSLSLVDGSSRVVSQRRYSPRANTWSILTSP